jgi:hypothetical protein
MFLCTQPSTYIVNSDLLKNFKPRMYQHYITYVFNSVAAIVYMYCMLLFFWFLLEEGEYLPKHVGKPVCKYNL